MNNSSADRGDRGDGFGDTSSTIYGEVKIAPRDKRTSAESQSQTSFEHAQRHLAFGLGSGISKHGQGLLHSLFDSVTAQNLGKIQYEQIKLSKEKKLMNKKFEIFFIKNIFFSKVLIIFVFIFFLSFKFINTNIVTLTIFLPS